MAQRSFVTHPVVVRRLTIAGVHDLNPRMRRVTLTGSQLAGFSSGGHELPKFVSTGFDDHVKLVFASDGDIAAALPVQLGHTVDWPEAPNRETRDYTVRRVDRDAGLIDLDFVRHGDGPAASWAETAAVGDELHLAGPKSSLVLPDDVDWVLLAGDETALPAIGRFLDERPVDVPVQVVVEVGHLDACQELALRPGDTARWVQNPTGTPGALGDAVQELEWWPGRVYSWAAAESGALLPLRRWLGRDRGVPKTHLNLTGYWHRQPPATTDAPAGPDAETLLSPVPWFATRAAVQLGLLDAVATRPRPIGELAAALSVGGGPLRTLVDYLVSVDVLAGGDGGCPVGLGGVGEQLIADDHLRESVEDTLESRAVDALAELAPALRGGGAPYARRHGRTLLDDLTSGPGPYAERLAEAQGFAFVARGALDLEPVRDARHMALTGVGSLALLEALDGRCTVTVVEPAAPLQVLCEAAGPLPAAFRSDFPDVDLAVCALGLSYRTDEEAVALLADMAAAADLALLVEQLVGPGLASSHVFEHRLLELGGTGAGMRSRGDVRRLAATAGWTVSSSSTLGWNYEAFLLSR